MPLRTLTIFMIKEDVAERDIFDSEATEGCTEFEVRLAGKPIGRLVAKQTPATPPGWLKLFGESLSHAPRLRRASVSAVFLTRAAGRFFVLAFGQGRHMLETGAYEERFGLRVTLNSVDPRSLRAVDVSTLDANPFHGTRQASREADLGEFGIDLDKDILRAVTGRPTEERLGRRMTGVDSLSVRVRADLTTLPGLLKRYLQKSEEDVYRQHFPWVDHVAEVRDKALVPQLFESMIHLINHRRPNVWAAIPERIDWTGFDTFRFGAKRDARSYDDIRLDRMLDCLDGSVASMEFLEHTAVFGLAEGNPHPVYKWSFLKCLAAEIDRDGAKYLLNSGKWYRVSTEFVDEIDRELAALLPDSSYQLPVWGDEYENVYNERVAAQSSGHIVLMDCVMVRHPGMSSPIEFCDLFTDDHRLVHVKRYGQSSVLSHLFMQGLASANSLLADARFRFEVNKHLPATHQLADPDVRPFPSQYEVVFAIGSSELGRLQLPFFSRVTLRNVVRMLTQSFGYRASLVKIKIDKFV